jgi:DNA-binding transcriptional LysR family regulator
MEIRQLEYFIAVAEEANFTRAAERVHISQSGVSAQIRQLEMDLGAPLIDRSGRRASLTTAGAAALPLAKAVLASVEEMRGAVDEVSGLVRGRIVIGMVSGCTVTPLFDAIAAFHLAHPGVDIALTEENSERLVERVRAGAIDIALVGSSGAPTRGLDLLPIVSERLVAALPPGHPLSGQTSLTLAEICASPVVCMPEGTGIRTVFDQACAAKGLRPRVAMEASSPMAVADIAARGLGIAILAASMVTSYAGWLRPLLVDDIETPAVLALVWATTVSPALRELLVDCRHAFRGFSLSVA